MKALLKIILVGLTLVVGLIAEAQKQNPMTAPTPTAEQTDHTNDKELVSDKAVSFFDLMATDGAGTLKPLKNLSGKVVIAVNTASKCGFTPQYKELQELQKKYESKGFAVLGFPSNDFNEQEPGTDAEIKKFCELNYGVTFPLYQKAPVSGEKKQPVFAYLTEKGPTETRGEVQWNFEKFVINRKGEIVARFPSKVTPQDPQLVAAVEKALAEKAPAETKPSAKKTKAKKS